MRHQGLLSLRKKRLLVYRVYTQTDRGMEFDLERNATQVKFRLFLEDLKSEIQGPLASRLVSSCADRAIARFLLPHPDLRAGVFDLAEHATCIQG